MKGKPAHPCAARYRELASLRLLDVYQFCFLSLYRLGNQEGKTAAVFSVGTNPTLPAGYIKQSRGGNGSTRKTHQPPRQEQGGRPRRRCTRGGREDDAPSGGNQRSAMAPSHTRPWMTRMHVKLGGYIGDDDDGDLQDIHIHICIVIMHGGFMVRICFL